MKLLMLFLFAFVAAADRADTAEGRLMTDVQALVDLRSRDSCAQGSGAGIEAAARWLHGKYSENKNLAVSFHDFKIHCGFKRSETRRNVVAVLEGGDLKNEIVMLGGHYDSISNDVSYAPGANDSGSQTALLLEVARRLSPTNFRRTVVLVSFAGEEQGLIGSKMFVRDLGLIFPGRRVVAMLNFDIVGGDRSANSVSDLKKFRLFSPNAEPHRSLAQKIGSLRLQDHPDFGAEINWRVDRPGRGGDHISFQTAGIPAVRFIEARENTAHQHSADDLPEHLTPEYLGAMAAFAAVAAMELAR